MKFLIVFPFSVIVQHQAELVASLFSSRMESEDRGLEALPQGNIQRAKLLFLQPDVQPRVVIHRGGTRPLTRPVVTEQQTEPHTLPIHEWAKFETTIGQRRIGQHVDLYGRQGLFTTNDKGTKLILGLNLLDKGITSLSSKYIFQDSICYL